MNGEAMQRLDPLEAPLSDLNLIEANAGTGKTWTITALYVRLLLEAQCSVESILVVTFTEAATGELRDRIRARLAETRDCFERGEAGDDRVGGALLERVDRSDALLRLTAAIRDFDQAPIYTIHGFCQRVLSDQAFDSGLPFRTEILVDQSALLQEIVEDFWRSEIASASALFTRYLAGSKVNPDGLRDLVRAHVGKPYVTVLKPADTDDAAALEQTFQGACARAREIWLAERAEIDAQLVGNAGLHAGRYRPASVAIWLDQMHGCLGGASIGLDLCESFDKFTAESLAAATKKGHNPPEHAFFSACQSVRDAKVALEPVFRNRVRLMKARLIAYCDAELAARKERRQLQSYDDLLLNLEAALRGDNAVSLAQALRERYSAALIDEFQDTDPVQYGIFRRIYGESALPVFLVGDPKQSIYSFRGADVFTYLEARSDAARRHTLDMNWRSGPRLLDAVNALFERSSAPFLFTDIPFRPSRAAAGPRGDFVVDGESGAPLEMWYLESTGKPIAKNEATELAADATAAEIARLLALAACEAARIVEPSRNEHPLRGGDIAVLVRNHRQARKIREALSALGVASVQRGAENVFSSLEAEELERVLLAIAEPGRESLIAAALTTELMGHSGETLHALRGNEAEWERAIERFREAHREWRDHGFIRMLRHLFQTYEVVTRLLEYGDGERRVTNLLHLAELVHCEAGALGAAGLVAWLAAKRRECNASIEAELLRLESDDNLVKILTIHVAKGLEFPLVFCPFLWDVTLWSAKDELVRFHDPAQDYRPFLDIEPADASASREQARREELAENLRLFYVALTRAKHRCWMVWGHIKDVEFSAPAWLLHGPTDARAAETVEAFSGRAVPLESERMRADLDRIAKASNGSIRISRAPAAPATRLAASSSAQPLQNAREFTGTLRDTRRVTSFTALAHGRTIEAPDYDAADRDPLPESVSGRDIFAFPRGAHAGTCLHAIFEKVDFAHLARPELERIVARELSAHGFDEAAWLRAIAGMVKAVSETPLDASGMRLADVPRARRFDELEFYFPIATLSDKALGALLLEHGFPDVIRERIDELSFATTQGYMRGFIDLVFEHDGRYYLADYKSNWLGPTVNAYQQADLARAMARETYYLQYLVYCVALHRYLAARVPGYRYESHFGGVRYLFLRGMNPASGPAFGVFADRPAAVLVEALDRYFATGSA